MVTGIVIGIASIVAISIVANYRQERSNEEYDRYREELT